MPVSLCEIFKLLSERTWDDIGDSYKRNLSLGEEGITDYLLLSLARACPRQIMLQKFNRREEGGTTGADWEWWFVGKKRSFGMRVQAKKLDIPSMRYRHLRYKTPGTKREQINLLINGARKQKPPLYPIYCFYNYWPDQSLSPNWNCHSFAPHSPLNGCTIADAHLVKGFTRMGLDDLATIGSISLPWICLACCAGYVPLEGEISDRAHSVAQAVARAEPPRELQGEIKFTRRRVPPPIEGRENLPPHVRRLLYSPLEPAILEEDSDFRTRKIDGLLIIKDSE